MPEPSPAFLSFSLFDAEGRLIDWNAGFSQELSDAATLLEPGVGVTEIQQSCVLPEQALDLSWVKYRVAPSPINYINNRRSIKVTQEFSREGSILRLAIVTGEESHPHYAPMDQSTELLRSSALKISTSILTHRTQLEESLRTAHAEAEKRTQELEAVVRENERITEEQRILIGKLGKAQNQLLQAEKMASIGQLAAGVAHEINNPLGYISSNLNTLRSYIADLLRLQAKGESVEHALPKDLQEELTQLKNEIDIAYLRNDIVSLLSESDKGLQRVKQIVQDLKDFSHVDESERLWANLENGLDSTLNVVWNELKYKAEVVKEYAGIPEIECYPSQLNQVFMNFLINSGQAIDGHGHIVLRTGHDEDNVWVDVEDDGKGIQPEHLKRIFEPFFTTKPVGKGTGLGLSLSYGIVQKHSGRIEVESTPGKGTRFRVVLPKHLRKEYACSSS